MKVACVYAAITFMLACAVSNAVGAAVYNGFLFGNVPQIPSDPSSKDVYITKAGKFSDPIEPQPGQNVTWAEISQSGDWSFHLRTEADIYAVTGQFWEATASISDSRTIQVDKYEYIVERPAYVTVEGNFHGVVYLGSTGYQDLHLQVGSWRNDLEYITDSTNFNIPISAQVPLNQDLSSYDLPISLSSSTWGHADVNFGDFSHTFEITDILLPDGHTPESEGWTLSFGDRSLSPNLGFNVKRTGLLPPEANGFTHTEFAGTSTVGPIITEDGHNLWRITSNTLPAQVGYHSNSFTDRQMNFINTQGFDLDFEARVLPNLAPTFTAQNPYVIGWAEAYFPTVRFDVALGLNEDGDTVVVLADSITCLSLQGQACRASGPTYTLTGSGSSLHSYQLRYDPTSQTADLFLDGVPVLTGYHGGTQYLDGTSGLAFSTTSGGTTDFGEVSLTSLPEHKPFVHGDIDANGSIDAADYVLARKYSLADDLVGVRAHFGTTYPVGSGASNVSTAVPEPGSMLLLITTLIGILKLRMRS